MSHLIQAIVHFFSNGVGNKIGNTVANVTALAALTPLALWFLHHKDETAVSVTYGQLALFGCMMFAVVKIVHYTRAGRPDDRGRLE